MVAGATLNIQQSPTVLTSTRVGGTTGAVLWQVTPAFANWLADSRSILWRTGLIHSRATVLELGCGCHAVIALALAHRVGAVLLTDQSYVARLVHANLNANKALLSSGASSSAIVAKGGKGRGGDTSRWNVEFRELDWELHQVTREFLTFNFASASSSISVAGADVVVACDCIYNETLISPLVDTLAAACEIRAQELEKHPETSSNNDYDAKPTCCVMVQQLRDSDVFCEFVTQMLHRFHLWRVPDSDLPYELRTDKGFVVHVAVLRPRGQEK